MILKRGEKVLLKKNQRYRCALPICKNKGFKILLSLLSYVKKMLNKLYNLFAKNGYVLKLRFERFLKRNIKIIPAQIKD